MDTDRRRTNKNINKKKKVWMARTHLKEKIKKKSPKKRSNGTQKEEEHQVGQKSHGFFIHHNQRRERHSVKWDV
jgi:hypothetical protein